MDYTCFHVMLVGNWKKRETGVYNATVNISFIVPVGSGGFFFFLSHAIIYFDVENNTSPFQYRIDIADAAPNNVVEFVEPPQINTDYTRV